MQFLALPQCQQWELLFKKLRVSLMKTSFDMLNIALGYILPETMGHLFLILQFYCILLSTLWNVGKLLLCPLLFSELYS